MDAEAVKWIDVKPEVMDAYNSKLAGEIAEVKIWAAGCRNYYSSASGQVVTQYPHNMTVYRDLTSVDDWQAFQVEREAAAS